MSQLRVTLACGEYDRTLGLIDGTVRAEGLDLQVIPMSDAFERHDRMLRQEAFDICELSMSSYLMARQRGQRFTAIPVFPYRMFRHGYVLINRRSGIREPADLRGKRIGIAMYQVTTALWVRGHLAHEYGVTPDQLRWFTDRPEVVGFTPPPGVVIETIPAGATLEGMLVSGDLDALILIEEVPEDLLKAPDVARLFPRYWEVEQDFYRRTRIYPIMHTVVIKDALLERHPWIAESVRKAFQQAKERALENLRYPRTSTLVWAGAYREAECELFGPDPYPYTLEDNMPTLEALVSYSYEQGLTTRRFSVEELFAPAS